MSENCILYCPKCSKNEFKQVDSKKFICNQCNFTFYKNPCSAVAAIIKYQDKIIMTVRGKEPGLGKLDLPGGFVNEDETLEEALIREVNEELSIKIHHISYLCSFPNIYPYKGVEYRTVDSVFVCTANSLEIKKEEKEIESWELIDINKLDFSNIAFISIKRALEKFLQIQ